MLTTPLTTETQPIPFPTAPRGRRAEAMGAGSWLAAAPDGKLTDHLRDGILTAVHLGRLQPGSRLPSIREAAQQLGVSNWAVSQAYAALQEEGVVESRARSGIFVTELERLRGGPVNETADWLARVLTEAGEHLIRIPILPDLIRRYTASVRLRCACVESDVDSLTALCQETERRFGLESFPVPADSLVARNGSPSTDGRQLPQPLRSADLAVTTAFHAPVVSGAVHGQGTPVAVATSSPEATRVIERHLRSSPRLTVVCVDPRFGRRVSALHEGARPDQIHVVVADDVDAIRALDPAEPVLLTQAARAELRDFSPRLLLPYFPSFALHHARGFVETLIRLNLAAAQSA